MFPCSKNMERGHIRCNPSRPLEESPGPSVYFETPETVFRLFRTLFGPAPGDSLETLSGFRARRARETPVRGGRGCNTFTKAALLFPPET